MNKMKEQATAPAAAAAAAPSPSVAKSFFTVFMHADAADNVLMLLGFVGAVGDGLSTPVMLLITSKIFNDLGSGPAPSPKCAESAVLGVRELGHGLPRGVLLDANRGAAGGADARGYLKAVLRQDVEYFDLKVGSTTEVITSVSSDSLVIQDVLSEKVPNFVMNASMFLGSYAVGFFLLWRLALVALPTVLLLIIPGLMYGRMLMGLAREIRDEYSKAGAVAEQAVSSVRTVYSFVAEARTMERFSAALQDSVRLGLRQGLAKGLAIGSNGITFAIWAFNVWYGSRLVMYHGAQGGTVFAVSASIVSTWVGAFQCEVLLGGDLGRRANSGSYQEGAEDRFGEYGGRGAGERVGGRRIQGGGIRVPVAAGEPDIREFQSESAGGRTVALVGGSGSGKSTVIALLERFYDPLGGEILVDGVDIRRLRLKWLRSQMGLVSQEPALFATSIKENILFGKEDATAEEVVAAAKASNAHNFISQLPHGYDTQVGERGVQMSGGQKQRIAIARAILKSPKILLLDEATSALDTESERVVQDALDAASIGRTTIVIAHRLSTVRNADVIAVMQAGEVRELGSHDELIADDGGLYSSLVRLQQAKDSREEGVLPAATGSSFQLGSSSHSMSRRFSAASRSSSARSSGKDDGGGDDAELRTLPVPSFRRLLMMNAPEWKQAVLGSFSAVVFGGVQPVYAYAMGSMISVYFLTDDGEIKAKTRAYALIFAGLSVLSFLINIGQHYNFGAMGEYLTKRVRERMLSKILTFEVGWFDQDDNSSGAICSQLAKDANVVRSLVGDRMALIIQTVSAVTIACTMGLVIAWRLALVMIAVQPLIIVCFYARRVLLKSMSKKAVKAQAESSKLAAEAVSNLRTVTAFSSQDRILRLFDVAQEGPRRESIRQSWFAGLGLATSMSLMTCTWALDFWYGGKLLAEGLITAKALFQTFMILVSTGRVIADAGSMTTDLAKGADAVGSVFAVLDRDTRINPEDPEGYKPEKLKGEVDIKGVDFAYPARPDVIIFKGFSLSIRAGKSTALVGQSGSGKSTIIGLIDRFYDPLKGSVRIDGRDIRAYHLRSVRRHIGMVGQEPTLFAGTIRDNIIYGTDAATEAEIENAARAANAHDFISNLKDGYGTWCGDRGVQLSGGQKQRIAIARAILKNPAILLLDEATSALDSQSEKVVQEALERVMVGRTSVVVAHRLSTIQNCDLIAVLEKGVVVEKGTHASLMAKGPTGTYFGLVRLQQGVKLGINQH
uniref:Multidrug resistance protein n=1 Tax=Ananas comosus var. bracteatus TaxID=296719 RepID=A0A6V7PLJ7_ANACO|nr:unnamed protein product [Ananas comosus var. bracteatus]